MVNYFSAVPHYVKLLPDYNKDIANELEDDIIEKIKIEYKEYNRTNDNYKKEPQPNIDSVPRNLIYFGAPGTGKSYLLNEELKKLKDKGSKDNEIDEEFFERVTFYPDYTYANFVGSYKPVMNKTMKNITYEYVPGPFMRILVKALNNREKKYVLVIEEINRANAAAVFGDMFQLLDRNEDGESVYDVAVAEEVKDYLDEKLAKEPDPEEKGRTKKIRLPGNMYIWATMNSADQGVYPMDTAFKRRWDFKYIGIDSEGKDWKLKLKGGECSWNKLRKAINSRLVNLGINEDKQMGFYFLKNQEPEKNQEDPERDQKDSGRNLKAFKDKVIMYLFEDAAKQKRDKIFKKTDEILSYSSICDQFDEVGIKIFVDDIKNKLTDSNKSDGSTQDGNGSGEKTSKDNNNESNESK